MKDRMPESTLTLLELWPEDPDFHLDHYAAKCLREAYDVIDAKTMTIEEQNATVKALQDEIERLRPFEPNLQEFNVGDGEITASVSFDKGQRLVENLAAFFVGMGAKNFLTTTLTNENHKLEVTIQDMTKSLTAQEKLANQAAEIARLTALVPTYEVCLWDHDTNWDIWDTECDNAFCFSSDGPTENGMKFCPYCGKHLVAVEPPPEDDVEDEA